MSQSTKSPALLQQLESRIFFSSGPVVTGLTMDNRGQAIVKTDQPLDPTTVNSSNVKLLTAGADNIFGTKDDVAQTASLVVKGKKLIITTVTPLPHDTRYRIRVGKTVLGAGTGLPLLGHYMGAFPTTATAGGNAAPFDATSGSTGTEVIFSTVSGNMLLQLNTATPTTTQNFIAYADAGKYDNIFVSRNGKSDSPPLGPIAILQGGGFEVTSADKLARVATLNDGITHERNGGSNLRGTIALARSSSANSGSAEWFFNETDNTFLDPEANDPNANTPDNDPGAGYTVFGTLANAHSLAVMDDIYALPTADLNPTSNGTETDVGLHSVPVTNNPTSGFDPQADLEIISRVAVLTAFTSTASARIAALQGDVNAFTAAQQTSNTQAISTNTDINNDVPAGTRGRTSLINAIEQLHSDAYNMQLSIGNDFQVVLDDQGTTSEDQALTQLQNDAASGRATLTPDFQSITQILSNRPALTANGTVQSDVNALNSDSANLKSAYQGLKNDLAAVLA